MHQFTHCTSHKHYISLHSGKITTLKLVSCSSKCSSRCQWSPTVKIFHIFYDNQLFITIFITIQDEEVQYCIFSQGLKKNHNTHSWESAHWFITFLTWTADSIKHWTTCYPRDNSYWSSLARSLDVALNWSQVMVQIIKVIPPKNKKKTVMQLTASHILY